MSHLFQLGETFVSPFSIPGSNTAIEVISLLLGPIKGRCWSKTGVCHISVNIQQILVKFTPLAYCVEILQIVKIDLICIMVAMVTDES